MAKDLVTLTNEMLERLWEITTEVQDVGEPAVVEPVIDEWIARQKLKEVFDELKEVAKQLSGMATFGNDGGLQTNGRNPSHTFSSCALIAEQVSRELEKGV